MMRFFQQTFNFSQNLEKSKKSQNPPSPSEGVFTLKVATYNCKIVEPALSPHSPSRELSVQLTVHTRDDTNAIYNLSIYTD